MWAREHRSARGAYRDMRVPPLSTDTWRHCGGRGSTAARGMRRRGSRRARVAVAARKHETDTMHIAVKRACTPTRLDTIRNTTSHLLLLVYLYSHHSKRNPRG
jgi:hypothetical protein